MLSKITIFPVSQTAKTELQNTELKIVWEVCCQQEKLAHQIGAGTIEFQVGVETMVLVSTRPNIYTVIQSSFYMLRHRKADMIILIYDNNSTVNWTTSLNPLGILFEQTLK